MSWLLDATQPTASSTGNKLVTGLVVAAIPVTLPLIFNWFKDRNASSRRLRQLDEATKIVAFWDSWLKTIGLLGAEESGFSYKDVARRELAWLADSVTTLRATRASSEPAHRPPPSSDMASITPSIVCRTGKPDRRQPTPPTRHSCVEWWDRRPSASEKHRATREPSPLQVCSIGCFWTKDRQTGTNVVCRKHPGSSSGRPPCAHYPCCIRLASPQRSNKLWCDSQPMPPPLVPRAATKPASSFCPSVPIGPNFACELIEETFHPMPSSRPDLCPKALATRSKVSGWCCSAGTRAFTLCVDWHLLAERVGFEPTVPCGTHAFQACALSHSAISPGL
jgi:hypothetical protein